MTIQEKYKAEEAAKWAKLEKLVAEGPEWLQEDIAYWTEYEPEQEEGEEPETGYTFRDAWNLVSDERFSQSKEDKRAGDWGPGPDERKQAAKDVRLMRKMEKAAGFDW